MFEKDEQSDVEDSEYDEAFQEEFDKYLQDDIQDAEEDVQTLLEDLVDPEPESKPETTIKINTAISSANLYPQNITYKGKQVQQITQIGYFANDDYDKNRKNLSATRVILRFKDNTETILQFRPDSSKYGNQYHFYRILCSANAIIEEANIAYGKLSNKSNWTGKKLPYSKEEKENYEIIHSQMSASLVRTIKKDPKHFAQAKAHGVCIIGLGTGDGKDISICFKALTKVFQKECMALGFDSNREIIAENIRNGSPHSFFTADNENIANTIKQLIDSHQLSIGNRLIAVIACGSLTRYVSEGTYAVHRVLEQLSAFNIGDILIASGQTNLMITTDSAGPAGWDVKASSFEISDDYQYMDSKRHIFTLNRLSNEEQFDAMFSRSRARSKDPRILSILDLSLTSIPVYLIQHFLAKKADLVDKVTQIDLSWAYILGQDLALLLEKIRLFTSLKHLTISEYEPWADKLIAEIKRNISDITFTLIKRTDSTNPNELPTLAVPLAKKLGVYVTVPNVVLLKGKSQSNLAGSESKPAANGAEIVTVHASAKEDSVACPEQKPVSYAETYAVHGMLGSTQGKIPNPDTRLDSFTSTFSPGD